MIFNTTGGSFIVYCNTFLQKNVFSPHVRNFTLFYGSYSCLIIVLFGPIFRIFFHFFKCSLNFKAYALKLELNKVGYTNFVKF